MVIRVLLWVIGGRDRPYKFAKKLKELPLNIGALVLVSAAVAKEEHLFDGGGWLCLQQLVDSFKSAGFDLVEVVFDTACVGGEIKEEYGGRLTTELPLKALISQSYVIGNYHFRAIH